MTFAEAERRLRGLPPCTARGWTALSTAHGRVAAETIRAGGDLPRVPRSAMDGYALRASDAAAGPLRCVDTRYAGDPAARALGTGECVAVATGAVLPEGADAVVPRERARVDESVVHMRAVPVPGENVVAPGEEGRSGTALVPAGERIGPRHIAALAAYGYDRVPVREPLRVAVVATGDEVVEPGAPVRPEQVYESSGPALEAELRVLGMQVDRFPPCPDREGALMARLGALLGCGKYDAILTTGGVSTGARDLVPSVWERLGAERLFWGVTAKPGKAMYVASAGPGWVLSLSGNPHAALAGFYTLVRPALAALAGLKLRDRRHGSLEEPTAVRRDRHRLLWAEPGSTPGAWRPLTGLSVWEALTRAAALLLVPPGATPLSAGDTVDLVALDPAGGPLP